MQASRQKASWWPQTFAKHDNAASCKQLDSLSLSEARQDFRQIACDPAGLLALQANSLGFTLDFVRCNEIASVASGFLQFHVRFRVLQCDCLRCSQIPWVSRQISCVATRLLGLDLNYCSLKPDSLLSGQNDCVSRKVDRIGARIAAIEPERLRPRI